MKNGMIILNTYKMEVDLTEEGYNAIIVGFVLLTIGLILSGFALRVAAIVFFILSVVATGVSVYFFRRDPIETDIDVTECLFESESALEEAKMEYEIVDSRGSIFTLVKKSDLESVSEEE